MHHFPPLRFCVSRQPAVGGWRGSQQENRQKESPVEGCAPPGRKLNHITTVPHMVIPMCPQGPGPPLGAHVATAPPLAPERNALPWLPPLCRTLPAGGLASSRGSDLGQETPCTSAHLRALDPVLSLICSHVFNGRCTKHLHRQS